MLGADLPFTPFRSLMTPTDRLDYKQMRERWEWKLGGQEIDGAESKFKFVFAEKRREGR